ncbi:MAG TPA: hypothetical protein DHU55_16085, partial [Blastocatellia bacterium]|nr:hypothetical protein [Blastocatellia bacterium]
MENVSSYFMLNCVTMSPSPRRILLLDAEAQSGEALKQLIASWGYDVVLQQNTSPGIQFISETDPAVIIDTSSLSPAEGSDVLRELRAQQSSIPVILVAESGTIELAIRAIQEEGAYHYFEKPVDANKLRVVLDLSLIHI